MPGKFLPAGPSRQSDKLPAVPIPKKLSTAKLRRGCDGDAALHRLVEREAPALVLLDVGLPGEDGFALARWLREKRSRVGIIMVTSAADTVDRVVRLETGADDYITKPFEPRELLARLKSVLRRGAPDRDTAPARRIAAILAADVAGYSSSSATMRKAPWRGSAPCDRT